VCGDFLSNRIICMSLFRAPVLLTTFSFGKDVEKLTSAGCGQRNVLLSFQNERVVNYTAVLKRGIYSR